jgi:hypothetical protein
MAPFVVTLASISAIFSTLPSPSTTTSSPFFGVVVMSTDLLDCLAPMSFLFYLQQTSVDDVCPPIRTHLPKNGDRSTNAPQKYLTCDIALGQTITLLGTAAIRVFRDSLAPESLIDNLFAEIARFKSVLTTVQNTKSQKITCKNR